MFKFIKKIYHHVMPSPIRNIISKIKYYGYYFFSQEIRKNPEIITIIDGGLGSQMGQYTMGQEIQRITGKQVSYDLSWYAKKGGSRDINGKANRFYELEKIFPNIKVRKADTKKVFLYEKLFRKHKRNSLLNNLDELDLSKPPIYLDGYWKTTKYSNYDIDSLRKMFIFDLKLDDKNKEIFDKINSCNCSVAVQIRMGDYLGSVLDVTNPGYFYNAINYLIKEKNLIDPHFFVFSDGIEKSREMLTMPPPPINLRMST